MKINVVHLTLIFASLIVMILPLSVHAESTANSESINTSANNIYKHKSPGASYEAATTITKNNKKILVTESREMSPFFILGIAINIVMVLVFGWWFSKEWRRKK